MGITTEGRLAATTIHGERVRGKRAAWEMVKRSWPATRIVMLQIGISATLAMSIAMIRHDDQPFFAGLFAVTATEFICARHHRRAVEMAFGASIGLLVAAVLDPTWPSRFAITDAYIGCAIAVLVALASTPRDPVRLVRTETDPLLGQLSTEIRSVAEALRTNNAVAAAQAVKALNQSERGLRSLEETMIQVRRSAPLTKWLRGTDLPALTTQASEVAEAVRSVRAMARHSWRGILAANQPVPPALPQMVEALADGTALLRTEMSEGVQPVNARQMLASAAQWADVLRQQNISLAAAAVAADAEAAVHSLMVATGLNSAEAAAATDRALVA